MNHPSLTRHSTPGPSDVEAAARRIAPILPPTPHHYCSHYRALLKLENLQVTGAYKVRGALNAVAAQIERGDRRSLIAASAGNHGQGIAWAARYFGLRATVVVPRGAPIAKIRGARDLGAEVILHGDSFEACSGLARQLASANDWRFVHPFDDPDVIAGQGTVGLELEGEHPDVVVVPIGGGGLAAGVGLALRARGVRVVGAQIAGVDAMRRHLAGLGGTEPKATIADGLAVRVPGELTSRICRDVLDDIVVVTEEEVRRTVVDLATREKLVVEGAGAVAVAALRLVSGQRRVAVVTGGNVDRAVLSKLLGAYSDESLSMGG